MHGKSPAVLAAMLLAAAASPPALAQAPAAGEEREQGSPEELAREGLERLMRALEGFLRTIPQYGVPRVEENGDIVIPRLDPPGREDGDDGAEGDDDGPLTETRT